MEQVSLLIYFNLFTVVVVVVVIVVVVVVMVVVTSLQRRYALRQHSCILMCKQC
jgi:hypothetical protein